jgi:hypothetical protein
MPSRKFKGILVAGHKEDAVEVPFDPGAQWPIQPVQITPGRRGYPVWATLEGIEFASFVLARSKKHWLLVDARVKALAKVATGDQLSISLAPGSASAT